jgi:calcineurin-like phosphoesterase family protein
MLDLTNENVYFVSDTHFNHTKLCKGYPDHFEKTRKYETVEEMNEDIVKQWNKYISKDDIVIFLGDFVWGEPYYEMPGWGKEFYPKLNNKGFIWIKGNHDGVLSRTFKGMLPFVEFKYKDKIYLCQHYDFNEKPELLENHKADYYIHGHTHTQNKTTKFSNGAIQNNVCWEAWYRPVHIDELVINTINVNNDGVWNEFFD